MNIRRHEHHAAAIRALNDEFRRTLQGGAVMVTAGIVALGFEAEARVIEAVRAFDGFGDANDPWREHDFGALDVELPGPSNQPPHVRVFFKIEYYDLTRAHHAANPADASQTERVMTIMLADEY